MSNETVSKPRTRRSPAEGTSTAAERPAAEVSETTKKPVVPKEIDPNQIITVRNGFQGRLVYKSKRTGERWSWNSNKKYFINNWFMFDEDWVIDYLGMRQYYKNSLNIQDFDQLFKKPVGEIEDIISKLSEGQRKSVAYRAKQLIAEEEIDSNRVINTLEKCLGVELVER